MIKAVIVDDEKKARSILRTLLTEMIKGVEIVGEAANAQEAINIINKVSPDIVFLDIEMPDGSGFTVLEELVNVDFKIIFTTAYNEYAIDAIKVSALDYLLKPVDIDELKISIQKLKEKLKKEEKRQAFIISENVESLFKQSGKIILPIPKGIKVVTISDIIYLKASGSYSEFVITNESNKIIVSKILKYFQEQLKDYGFVRSHDSYLVNLAHIDSYIRGRGGELILKNGEKLDVSRNKKENLLNSLKNLI